MQKKTVSTLLLLSVVKGAFYKQRADDITWENDRGIYRVYGPALQRSDEKAYSTDVWV